MYRVAHVQIKDGPRLRCYCQPDLAIHESDDCIFESGKVLEIGVVSDIESMEGVSSSERRDMPRVVRVATLQDQAKASEGTLRSKMAFDTCAEKAKKHELGITLVQVRFSFDRSVLMVLFTSDERVDFREMVKELAGELHARIEMKQIGVRDEAGMIGGVGVCGRCLCCAEWLTQFESINVKMAKDQRLSLNPAAISGMCGRLKCCLRYEHESYKALGKNLPRDGATVKGPDGEGYVVDKNIISQHVRVRLKDGREFVYHVDDIEQGCNGDGNKCPCKNKENDSAKEAKK